MRTLSAAALAAVALAAASPARAALDTPPSDAVAREVTIVAGGDILVHQAVWARALADGGGRYDFRPMFRHLRPLLTKADLALCHAETPLAPGPPQGYPVFSTPPALARAIAWAGWDACSTASNHSVDRGRAGIRSTLGALSRAGVRHTGTARTRREARRILLLDAGGVTVAFLAATYGTNGLPLPRPWSVDLIRPKRILADARRARRQGADLVVVNLHWGAEYVHRPTREQRALARRLLRGGSVDLIVGQHAHVVQPIGRVRGRFVVYGEGNLLSAQSTACCPGPTQDGLVAVVHVRVERERVSVRRVDYVPIYVRRPDFVVVQVGLRLRRLRAAGGSAGAEAQALRASRKRTVSVVGENRVTRPLAGRGWRR